MICASTALYLKRLNVKLFYKKHLEETLDFIEKRRTTSYEMVLLFSSLQVKLVVGRARIMRINLPIVLEEGDGSAATTEGGVAYIL